MKEKISSFFNSFFEWIDNTFEKVTIKDDIVGSILNPNGILALAIFILGVFYCLLGSKFPKLTLTPIFSIVIFSFLKAQSQTVDSIVQTVTNFILTILKGIENSLPDQLKFLTDERSMIIGYIVISMLLAVIICYLASVGKFLGFVYLFYLIHEKIAEIFGNGGGKIEGEINLKAIVISIAFIIIAYYIYSIFEFIAVALLDCTMGSLVILIGTSRVFEIPKDFYEFIRKAIVSQAKAIENSVTIESGVFNTDCFVYFLLLVSFTFLIQVTCFKNKS